MIIEIQNTSTTFKIISVMKRAIKLVFYYYGYQLLFSLPFMFIFNPLANTGTVSAETDATYATGIGMVLSGIVMIWHLIHFKYV